MGRKGGGRASPPPQLKSLVDRVCFDPPIGCGPINNYIGTSFSAVLWILCTHLYCPPPPKLGITSYAYVHVLMYAGSSS